MSHHQPNPIEHPEIQRVGVSGYILTFVISLLGMVAAYGLVTSRAMAPTDLLTVLSVIALVIGLIQLYFLFNLDLSKTMIYHTISLVLIIPLFMMAIGLTIWMFHGLMTHMMISGLIH